MSTRTLILWVIEFLAITAIAVILDTTYSRLWIVLPAIALLASRFSEYYMASLERHEVIRRQLQLLLALMPHGRANLRCTYHYPLRRWNVTKLVQAFDYLPQGGGGGRRFDIKKGIIAKTYTAKGPRIENFENDQEYRHRMVQEYNYSEDELRDITSDRRSYACCPIVDENHTVLGLIYIDANVSGTFTDDMTNPRWRMLNATANVLREQVLNAR